MFDAGQFNRLPAEVGLRLLGRAIARTGDEGSLQLGKLEILDEALQSANADDASRWRRTLAGALVTLGGTHLAIERAPARRAGAARAVWKLKKLAKSATQGRQDGKRN